MRDFTVIDSKVKIIFEIYNNHSTLKMRSVKVGRVCIRSICYYYI